ncbi:MAG: haloacid dehalogenase type II [Bacteroidetes bacterium SW_9_63_38]|nr:MAG: haloacid dehalogenase type II [Bacteroidetes bacterium SW_9_63_38]
MSLDAADYDAITFDCYGTLIDWRRGITQVLRPILENHDVSVDEDTLFEQYLAFEADVEGGDYVPYREVLRRVTRRLGTHFDFTPTNADAERLADSVSTWPPFADTNDGLRRLQEDFRLAVVSNVDDDLFEETARHFSVSFDTVVTGEQVGRSKPALDPLATAFSRLGAPPNRVLHVAQSVYHDLNPAGRLGLACVWVRRYDGRFTDAEPRTAPAATVPDLATLADMLLV